MVRTNRRAAAAAMALVASTMTFLAVAEPANGAAACTPADAPPRVLAVHAEDVTFSTPFEHRAMHVTVQNACGGTSTYECDNTQPTTSCTGVELRLRRSSTVGTQARFCSHRRDTVDSGSGAGPVATPTPGVYNYPLSVSWSLEYDDATEQPAMTNACAGPWDVIATPTNTTKVNDTYTTTRGESFTATAAFSLYRGSRLTTNASRGPVRRGATVTVYVGFAGERVVLQRRTLSGSYSTIKTVRSSKNGYVTTSVKALSEDRCYRWVYRGSPTTLAVVAAGDCVHVVRR